MNYQELREFKIKDIEKKLRKNKSVSRWAVGPYRFELRQRLSDDENALEELEKLIEYANESIQ
tara:strand:- start:118 stop:306 length:189 start_codon:yes stop_codon:yes gene_type:complete